MAPVKVHIMDSTLIKERIVEMKLNMNELITQCNGVPYMLPQDDMSFFVFLQNGIEEYQEMLDEISLRECLA